MFTLKLDLKCAATVTPDMFLRKQEPPLIRHGFPFPVIPAQAGIQG